MCLPDKHVGVILRRNALAQPLIQCSGVVEIAIFIKRRRDERRLFTDGKAWRGLVRDLSIYGQRLFGFTSMRAEAESDQNGADWFHDGHLEKTVLNPAIR